MEILEDGYIFTDDKAKVRPDEVCRLLRQSHWAKSRSVEIISKTIEGSLCFMVYHRDVLIGFARVISDRTVYSLILDVIIDENYRGKGLGKRLMDFIDNHPDIRHTSKVLWTKYAAGLYEKCGFTEESRYTLMFKRN